jgi:hypothetical protein
VYQRYSQEQKPKNRETFSETHHNELALFEAARRYLAAHLNRRKTIPLKKRKEEHAMLSRKKDTLNWEFERLKEEVKKS